MRSNRYWAIVLGGALVLSAVAAVLVRQAPAGRALIYSDGALVKSIALSPVVEPYSFTVESGSGVNVISVERGRICVSDANCPDGFCVRQGWISSGVVPIVCLPHGLVIRLEGGGPPDFDAVASGVSHRNKSR